MNTKLINMTKALILEEWGRGVFLKIIKCKAFAAGYLGSGYIKEKAENLLYFQAAAFAAQGAFLGQIL